MKISETIIVMLLILSAFSGLNLISDNVSASNPTITNSGCSPTWTPAGVPILFWCTYTDADNDSPTYVRVGLITLTSGTLFLKNMVANNTDDTNYVDGKQYNYLWYYFATLGAVTYTVRVASNGSSEITDNIYLTTLERCVITKQGVTPISHNETDYTFFCNYTSVWGYNPQYMNLTLNGIEYIMNKNNSLDINYINGVNYSFEINLTSGIYVYSFHTKENGVPVTFPEIINGQYWFEVRKETDWNLIGIVGVTIGMIITIGLLAVWKKHE